MPVAKPTAGGFTSPDGAAYDAVTALNATIDRLNDLDDSLTTESAEDLDTRVTALEDLTDGLTAGAVVASGTQAAHIADPSGSVTDQDDEARAAIASILNALEAFGIVDTA